MQHTIKYYPSTYQDDFPICPTCGKKEFAVYQCSCGKIFCRSCAKEKIKYLKEEDILEVTCPDCGTTVLFV